MPDIPFTAAGELAMRTACGLTRPLDRPPTAADVLVILETRAIVEREWTRWHGLDPPEDP